MNRADFEKLLVGFAMGALVASVVFRVARRPAPASEAVAPVASVAPALASNEVVVALPALPAPPRDLNAIRQHLSDRQNGTFIAEHLIERDSSLARWIDRRADPIRVWIDERAALARPEQQLSTQVRAAFRDWGIAGVPVSFSFVPDSAGAEVTVTFVDRFDEDMSGRTLWKRDQNWWIVGGDIVLALRGASDHEMTDEQVYAIALHEVGHLLGLDHTNDTTAIMAPRVSVLTLSQLDIATMRLIYEVPPGPVK